jgi:hypothetical protein
MKGSAKIFTDKQTCQFDICCVEELLLLQH